MSPGRVIPRLQERDVMPDKVANDMRPREAASLEVHNRGCHRLEVVTTLGRSAPELERNRDNVLEFWLGRAPPGDGPPG